MIGFATKHSSLLPECSPGTCGTYPLKVLSCVLGSCTLGTAKEKAKWLTLLFKLWKWIQKGLVYFAVWGRAVSCMSPQRLVCWLLHSDPLGRGSGLCRSSSLSSPSRHRRSFWCTAQTRQEEAHRNVCTEEALLFFKFTYWFSFTHQSVLSHMPRDVCVTGGSAAGLDGGRSWQSTAGMVGQMFTSRPHADHLPGLLAFPASHGALANT